MDEQKLQKLQDEMMAEIDKKAELEAHIESSAKAIASELMAKKRTRAVIDNSTFSMTYHIYLDEKDNQKKISVIAIDELKFKLSLGKYRPFLINAVADNEFSEIENLEKVVESFIRHKAGIIKPEELE